MKEFRKNGQGNFIYEECGKTFKNLKGLSPHIKYMHFSQKEYFNKWLKEKDDNICKKIQNYGIKDLMN